MDFLKIQGGNPLIGEIEVSGSKNSALPIIASGLMVDGCLTLKNVPNLADTKLMLKLLDQLGMDVKSNKEQIEIKGNVNRYNAPYDLVKKMRASILVLGPLLSKYGFAQVSLPGGCAIGTRPVDLHIKTMQSLGAIVELADGYIQAKASKGLIGGKIVFPFISVGATENAIMAAIFAKGSTEIINAAKEPEIEDLAECLISMGAKISGQGTNRILIEGVTSLSNTNYEIVPDRIEAGTFAIAVAMTGGELIIKNFYHRHHDSLLNILKLCGINFVIKGNSLKIKSNQSYNAVDIDTSPYPGFPTDLQAQYMAMMTLADGTSNISETIFENRFMHVSELMRMGADIKVKGKTAVIKGKEKLLPAQVMATDLRASVSLVLAALTAKGTTIVNRIYHLDRGYATLEKKLGKCGAILERIKN